MGVDHGLQGKNNQKGKDRRFKKSKRVKAIAMAALQGGKKKEVIFNEESRIEWLTGFRKRKSERRQYGLAMQILKDKKHKSEMRKARSGIVDNSEDQDVSSSTNEQLDITTDKVNPNEQVSSFNDEATNAMFGGDVSVVVNVGIVNDIGPEGELGGQASIKKAKKESTTFEKAMKKAKEVMGKKKSAKKNKKILSKVIENNPNDRKLQWMNGRKKKK